MSTSTDTAVQLLASLRHRNQKHDPSNQVYTYPHGSLVEVSGSAGSGKTQLLYLICAITLLPQKWSSSSHPIAIAVGGKGEAVVYIDTDAKLSSLRLREVMSHHLTITVPSLSLNDRHEVIFQALQRLHIFRPISSTSLLATLRFLPTYICTPSSGLVDTKIGLVALDSLSAFFWQDRYQAPTKLNDHLDNKIAKTLKHFCLTHSCFAICTNHSPQTWNNAVNFRVRLQKGQIRQYHGMTLTEAWEASQREDSETRREIIVKTERGGTTKLFVDGEGCYMLDVGGDNVLM